MAVQGRGCLCAVAMLRLFLDTHRQRGAFAGGGWVRITVVVETIVLMTGTDLVGLARG